MLRSFIIIALPFLAQCLGHQQLQVKCGEIRLGTNVKLQRNQKQVHLVRHAQGIHNVAGHAWCNKEYEDPTLTLLGVHQCSSLKNKTEQYLRNVEAVFTSPLRRTLQTGQYSFSQLQTKIPWYAHELLRESTRRQCFGEKRKARDEVKRNFTFVNFDLITDNEDQLWNIYPREPVEQMVKRGQLFLQFLSLRSENEVIVVSHSRFILHFLRSVLGIRNPKAFDNCELRTYILTFLNNSAVGTVTNT